MRRQRSLSPFRIVTILLAILVAFYVLVPLISISLLSINSRISIWPEQITFRWYQMRLTTLLNSVKTSFLVSIPAVMIALTISLPLGYALARYEFRGKRLISQIVVLPIVIPGVALGLAFLQMFNTGVFRNLHPLAVLIIAHVSIAIPYTARPIIAGFEQLDQGLEEASSTLGARPFRTFVKIILPMLIPSVLAGGIIALARSLNDFIITIFLVQPDYVPLAVQVYRTTQYGIPQLTSAMGVVLLVFSVAFATVAELLFRIEVEL